MNDNKRVLIKYGGNAMKDSNLQEKVAIEIKKLYRSGFELVLVHGGGPFIAEVLERAGITSEFIGGHRATSTEAMVQVEMALKGMVNGSLVRVLQSFGIKAVGLSGKDGGSVIAKKRWHLEVQGDLEKKIDLGQVGDVAEINTDLAELLLKNQYLPVFTCIASDHNGSDFNINADLFAGHLAGALQVDHFIVLTDVDGLFRDISKVDSLIDHLSVKDIEPLMHKVIKGGMIPKIESCQVALKTGAKTARILNGTQPQQLTDVLISGKKLGTTITSHAQHN
nr:acetylglutamate kinase [Saprospiraceae bacterium]